MTTLDPPGEQTARSRPPFVPRPLPPRKSRTLPIAVACVIASSALTAAAMWSLWPDTSAVQRAAYQEGIEAGRRKTEEAKYAADVAASNERIEKIRLQQAAVTAGAMPPASLPTGKRVDSLRTYGEKPVSKQPEYVNEVYLPPGTSTANMYAESTDARPTQEFGPSRAERLEADKMVSTKCNPQLFSSEANLRECERRESIAAAAIRTNEFNTSKQVKEVQAARVACAKKHAGDLQARYECEKRALQ